MRNNFLIAAAALLIGVAAIGCGKSEYVTGVEKWRVDHETELKNETGWLTVAGLSWLEEGANTVGAGPDYQVALTDNFKQGKFGEIDFHDGKAFLRVEPGVEATVDGKPVSTIELVSDEDGRQTKV